MFLAIDHMRRVRTRALSPDKTVTATLSAEAGLAVRFAFGCLNNHTVTSLATQVRAAVTGVLTAYEQAGDQVLRDECEPDALDTAWRTDAGRRLKPFVEALERAKVTGIGARGLVKVGMVDGAFRVAFRPAALELRESRLADELGSALTAMYDHRSQEAARLYDELVVSPKEPA